MTSEVLTPTIGQIATLLGYDGTDFSALLVDSDGHLQADILSLVLATNAAKESKQQPIEDVLTESVVNDAHAAGSIRVSGSAVPAGKIYTLTCFNGSYSSGACTAMIFRVLIDGSDTRVYYVATPTLNVIYTYPFPISLGPGDSAGVQFNGVGLNAPLTFRTVINVLSIPS